MPFYIAFLSLYNACVRRLKSNGADLSEPFPFPLNFLASQLVTGQQYCQWLKRISNRNMMSTSDVNHRARGIFILSTYRSGSTLLRYVIDTHPDICSPGELNLSHLCFRLSHAIDSTIVQSSSPIKKAMREKMVRAKARQIISDIMESYTNAKGKKMWCEKSPSNLIHLDILKGVFPDSKFICLYRHCLDVAHSLIEYSRYGLMEAMVPYVHRNPNSIINATVEYWIEQTRKMLNFERENALQCFRVKYESIVLETSQTLDGLFTFFGIKWDPKMLEAIFTTRHDPGHGDTKVLFTKNIEASNIGKGTALPRALVSPRLIEEANLLLEELGYLPIGPK